MSIIMQSLVFELYGSKYTFDYQRTIHIEREGLKIGRGGKSERIKIGKYARVRSRRVVGLCKYGDDNGSNDYIKMGKGQW